jgi:5-methylcytosine-specific restriction endonuclease McrA
MNRDKYPWNWEAIAKRIKSEAGWCCQLCGLVCRRPGEPFDTHRRTLTVAHINHVESDCDDTNLVALCPKCHLAYDRRRLQLQRLARQRIKANS